MIKRLLCQTKDWRNKCPNVLINRAVLNASGPTVSGKGCKPKTGGMFLIVAGPVGVSL